MTKLLKIKAFSTSSDGSTNMLTNRLAIINDTNITLRSLIANKISDKINEAVPSFLFSADQHIIRVETSCDEMDVVELLDLPVSALLEFLASPRPEIAVTINTGAEASDNNIEEDNIASRSKSNSTAKSGDSDIGVTNNSMNSNLTGGSSNGINNISNTNIRRRRELEESGNNASNNVSSGVVDTTPMGHSEEGGDGEGKSFNDANCDSPESDQTGGNGNVSSSGDKDERATVHRSNYSSDHVDRKSNTSEDPDVNSEFIVDARHRINEHDVLLTRKASTDGECKVDDIQESDQRQSIGGFEEKKESKEGGNDDGEEELPEGLDALAQLVYKAFKANPQDAIKMFDPSRPSRLHLLGPMSLRFDNITDEVSVMTPATCLLSEPDAKNLATHEGKDERYLESSPDLASLEQSLNNCDDALAIIVLTQALMQDNSTAISFDVPSFCLNALWVLARKNDENKRKIILDDSTFDAIIEAMQIYRESSSEIQIRGCGLLWTLAMNPKDRVHVAQLGGCTAILNAMSFHKDAEKLIAMALGALKVLSTDKVGKQMLNSEKTSTIVTEVMKAHMYNPAVQCEGCILLGNLAVNDADQFVHPVSKKEINVVVNCMLANPDSLGVHEAACFTLMRLASSATNVELIRNNTTTRASLELAFQQNPDKVKNNILILLRRLRIDSPTINEAKAESVAYTHMR